MKLIYLIVFVFFSVVGKAAIPEVSSGTIERFFLASEHVNGRNIDVWLPDGYTPSKKYATLYMHDGQSLFDKAGMWNGKEWRVDETVDSLLATSSIQDIIIIGIANDGNNRFAEYFPEKVISGISLDFRDKLLAFMPDGPKADSYLSFITEELKPFIDQHFSTLPDREHTYICGSSMGGLISLYALCEYPDVFAGAACISTHWIGILEPNSQIPEAIGRYLAVQLPPAKDHKLYFDCGTEGLDTSYPVHQSAIDALLKDKGYGEALLKSLVFRGAGHSEEFWAARFYIPVEFLLDKTL